MIETILNTIENILLPLGALGVFVGAMIEEVLAPLPSPLVMMSAGFFFLEGSFSWELFRNLIFIIAIPYALGVTLASFIVFSIAYFAGEPMLNKWGKWFGFSWEGVQKVQNKFKGTSKDEFTLFGLRIIPLVPSVILAGLCGLVKMNVKKYALITFLGVAIRGAIFGLLGWQVGSFYETYALVFAKFERFAFLIVVLAVIAFFIFKKTRKEKRNDKKKPEENPF